MSTISIDTQQRSQTILAQLTAARKEFEAAERGLEAAQQTLRDYTTDFIDFLRQVRTELTEVLRRGGEKRHMVEVVGQSLSFAGTVLETLTEGRSYFEDQPTLSMIDSYIREANDIADWMRQLSQQASKPIPAFDESKLPPAPTGPKAEGFVSIAEAKARRSH